MIAGLNGKEARGLARSRVRDGSQGRSGMRPYRGSGGRAGPGEFGVVSTVSDILNERGGGVANKGDF